jgi:hypothetical protein
LYPCVEISEKPDFNLKPTKDTGYSLSPSSFLLLLPSSPTSFPYFLLHPPSSILLPPSNNNTPLSYYYFPHSILLPPPSSSFLTPSIQNLTRISKFLIISVNRFERKKNIQLAIHAFKMYEGDDNARRNEEDGTLTQKRNEGRGGWEV